MNVYYARRMLDTIFLSSIYLIRPRLVRGLGPWIGLANTSVS
jgi:hypothetical protein